MNLIKKKGTNVAYIVEGFDPVAEEFVAAEEVRLLMEAMEFINQPMQA